MNQDEILKKFGKNVKLARIKKDYSQDQLAEKLNVTQNYITKIETGRQNMSLKKIAELAEGIGVDIEELLQFKE